MTSGAVGDPVAEFLEEQGAGQFAYAQGRTLLDHLLGTRDVVRRWSQPRWVQDAAAVHSVYSTDAYEAELFSRSSRKDVSEIVGARAERLAHLFCVVPRRSLFSRFEPPTALPAQTVKIACRDESVAELTRSDVCHLLLMHMANAAEQICDDDGGPGLWLSRVSRRGALLVPSEMLIPPIFQGCTQVVAPEDEERARDAYRSGVESLGEPDTARQHFVSASLACPWVGEPLVWRAYLALGSGLPAEASVWSSEAARRLTQLGVTWDKRLTYDEWLSLVSLLRRACDAGGGSLPGFDMSCPSDSLTASMARLEELAQRPNGPGARLHSR